MLLGAGLLAVIVNLVTIVPIGARFPDAPVWFVPFAVAFAGGVVAFRAQPANLAARRLLLFGVLGVVWMACNYVVVLAYDGPHENSWFVPANLVLQILGLAMVTALVALLAVFPDGSQGTTEKRVVRALAVLALAVPVVLLLASPEVVPAWIFDWNDQTDRLAAPEGVHSALHVGALDWLAPPLSGYLDAALGLLPLIGVAIAALRYRGLTAAGRVQMKWPLSATLVLASLPLGDLLVSSGALPGVVGDLIQINALSVLPLAITIGLVRPQLFDIEGVVRRAGAFLLLWTLVGGVYAGIAAALGVALGGENLQVAVAVAIVATLLFEPARRALARRAARFAGGEAVSGEELMRRLGEALEHTLDTEELGRTIAATAREGLGARWVRLRIEGGPDLVDGAVPRAGELPALTATLAASGRRIGVIECGASAIGRVYAREHDLLDTLARQAGLALWNARLAEELGARLDELSASRARIVEAEERARRRIERDIHDGSQQEIAALIARIGLARNQMRRDPSLALDTLEDLQSEARQALENLRELALGIHPSVLSDRGIVEAIEARAARLPLGVTLECEPGLRRVRFEEAVEGAVWFLVSECFANTLKHAGAERAIVRLERVSGTLVVEVSDDGRGFDAAGGDGLAGLKDRVAALDGRLEVESAPGVGTLVRASLPARERALA
jgi:signal transduction histidine kinase